MGTWTTRGTVQQPNHAFELSESVQDRTKGVHPQTLEGEHDVIDHVLKTEGIDMTYAGLWMS